MIKFSTASSQAVFRRLGTSQQNQRIRAALMFVEAVVEAIATQSKTLPITRTDHENIGYNVLMLKVLKNSVLLVGSETVNDKLNPFHIHSVDIIVLTTSHFLLFGIYDVSECRESIEEVIAVIS